MGGSCQAGAGPHSAQELVGAGEPFEVVFVSSDKSAEELMVYMKVGE